MKSTRNAFTVMELLIVVMIIMILMAFSLKVFGVVISQAKTSKTKTTIAKIQSLLDARAQALQRMPKFSRSPDDSIVARAYPAGSYTQSVITQKMLAARWFPQSAVDLLDPNAVRGMSRNYPKLVNTDGSLINPLITPGEIFYDFLTQEANLGSPPVGVDAFDAKEVYSDLIGLPVFMDAWGNPIRFYRWPTRLIRPQGQTAVLKAPALTLADITYATIASGALPNNAIRADGYSDLGKDPQDPLHSLWVIMPENTLLPGTAIPAPTPDTWWTFVVVSAGPDGKFGMYPVDDLQNNGHLGAVKDADALADDIFSISNKAGGR